MKSVKRRHSAHSRANDSANTSGLQLPHVQTRLGDPSMTSSVSVLNVSSTNISVKEGTEHPAPPSKPKIAYNTRTQSKSTIAHNECTKSKANISYIKGTIASTSKVVLVDSVKSRSRIGFGDVAKSTAALVGKELQHRKRHHKRSDFETNFTQGEDVPAEVKDAFKYRSRTQGGLHHFGIGKGGVTRTVVRFTAAPARHPTTLCFQFPSTCLTHRFILDMVKEKLHFVSGAGVTSILFADRNVLLGSRGLDNRWIIVLTSTEARDELMRLGLYLFNKRVPLRHYDDVLQEEYRDYQEYVELQEKLFGKIMPDDIDLEQLNTDCNQDTYFDKKGKKKKGKKGINKNKMNDDIDGGDKVVDNNDSKRCESHKGDNVGGENGDRSGIDEETLPHRNTIVHNTDSSHPLNEDVIIVNRMTPSWTIQ